MAEFFVVGHSLKFRPRQTRPGVQIFSAREAAFHDLRIYDITDCAVWACERFFILLIYNNQVDYGEVENESCR